MKIRAELHLGDKTAHVILVARPEEKEDHLALKLAAFAMFLPGDPIVEPSADHPALQGVDLRPDLCVLTEGGDMKVWIECGEVSTNKLDKAIRRFPEARVVVLKSTLHQARRQREVVDELIRNSHKIEIWAWPEGGFKEWMAAMDEKTELFGDAHEKSFNLVVNNAAYAVDLIAL